MYGDGERECSGAKHRFAHVFFSELEKNFFAMGNTPRACIRRSMKFARDDVLENFVV